MTIPAMWPDIPDFRRADAFEARTLIGLSARSRLPRRLRAFIAALAAIVGAGCTTLSTTDGAPAQTWTKAWRVGLAFSGQPVLNWPQRLKPGTAGDLVPWTEGLALSLLYPPSWLLGSPLWVPGANSAEYAACRDAARAAPERVAERLNQLAHWHFAEALNDRLELRVSGRERDRVVLKTGLAAVPPMGETTALLAAAAAKQAQAVIAFDASKIEIWGTPSGGCSVGLFIDGRVRALHVPDGMALAMPPLNLQVCRTPTAIPLERFLRDDDALRLAVEAAADCIVREVLDWTDRP